ncbi:SusC/RagA family TonB-linked outer membrane protein [Geofilum sp. OHC36d9]|uniref:SusC/RagA family TonB-linked outer membrane protein n=1 Tax=Geofilum sp. OHC36d9 TaxID=3458413 RepID=UPI0040344A58
MRKKLIKCLAVVVLYLISTIAYTQTTRTITGLVVDGQSLPLPGVNVVIQGSTTGTITNSEGKFSLELKTPAQNSLVFSFIGFKEQVVSIGTQTTLNVTMEEDLVGLDEVVAIGYGVIKRRDLTGSVGSVGADQISKTTGSNAIQAIQGRVPGVDIQQSSGEAGAGISINLRGNRSLTASNDPLILVDGIEYGSTLDINPSDIETMDILKDASSTAIYGSKGANGVIIITTKKGKAGKTVVNFNSFVSSNQPTHVPKVMYGLKEVQRLIDKSNYAANYEVYKTTGQWGATSYSVEDVLTESGVDFTEMDVYNDGSYTDWLDIILQNGLTHSYDVSISGGTEKTTFNISMGAMYEEGLMKNDELDRYNIKTTIDHKISDNFKVGTNIMYTYKDHDARNSSVFGQALKMTSIAHAYTQDGEIIETPNPRYAAHANPLLDEVEGAYQKNTESTRFFGISYLEITPITGIHFKTTFALDRSNSRIGTYQDYQSVARYQSPGTSYISSEYQNSTKYTWENILSYHTNFSDSFHDLTAMLGHSMDQKVYEQNITSGDAGREHYYESAFYDLSKISTSTTTSDYEKESRISYFGRLNYNYTEKYLLTASVRADGASTLASGNKWGYFPSISGAWRINEESFMSTTNNWLTNLKLRLSWGATGNSAIKPYETLGMLSERQYYYYINGSDIPANLPSNFANANLKWETTSAYNYGIDFGLFNNRVSGNIDFFTSKTKDLLYFKSAPPTSTYPSIIDNIGETKASGIEISLNTYIFKSTNFSWDINWSYSSFKDEVTGLADGIEKNIIGRTAHIIGEPVSIYYDYKANGNWDINEYANYLAEWQDRHPDSSPEYISAYGAPGTIKIVDQNDDGKIDDEDKVVYNRSPKHIFGMNNNFSYKNLALSVLVYARVGGYMQYDMNSQLNFESANWGDLDYWTPNNTNAKFPNPGTESATYGSYGTSLLYEKANYLKIKDITLAYSLPTNMLERVGINKIKIYGSLKNYFTFSSVSNYDSERDGSINFPLAKQMVFGINVQF